MAARGARSRKIVEHEINKKTDKETAKRDRLKTPALRTSSGDSHRTVVTSPIAGWGRKNQSIVSSSVSTFSRESDTSSVYGNGQFRAPSRLSDLDQFQGKGKDSQAPRGRGAGVPRKLSDAHSSRAYIRSVKSRSATSQQRNRSDGAQLDDPDAVTAQSWARTRIWSGGGVAPKLYAGFEHDDDMWMADGNCLIFFSEETEERDPRPMLRVHSSVLEQARSIFMSNLLKFGEIVVEDDATPPASRSGTQSSSSNPNAWPLTEMSLGSLDELLNENRSNLTLRPASRMSIGSHTWSTSGQTFIPGDASDIARLNDSIRMPPNIGRARGHDPQEESSKSSSVDPNAPVEITHEIWFRAPSHINRADIQRRHHMATRNYLALLYGLPIIGNDYFQMFSDLQNVMDTYYELNDPAERWNSAQVIVQYLTQRKLDDVRGNPLAALGLMAWSEQSNVGWDAGYLEGFVHSVGMMSPNTVNTPEFKSLSQVSRHKLQNAFNALQLRLIEAEERLERFDFPEIWYADGITSNHPAERAFNEFRTFLQQFYQSEYGQWPPAEHDHQDHWITKALVNRLQTDLGALYDYLVDREIHWDVDENRPTRKWEMICSTAPRGPSFTADAAGFPLTNMLIGFDSSMRYEHIPHPYPLLPHVSPVMKEKSVIKRGLFGKKSKKDSPPPNPKEEYKMALAFTAATNINRLGPSFKDNKLLDAFQAHEKSFSPVALPAADARLGRWILLYATLQILSTLSVDTVGLRFSEKIRYFACPSLEGCPPWRTSATTSSDSTPANPSPGDGGIMHEAKQTSSYCWLAPARWKLDGGLSPNALAAIGSQQNLSELDGRNVARMPSIRTPVILASSRGNSPHVTPVLSPTRTPRLQPASAPALSSSSLSPIASVGDSYVDPKPDIPQRSPKREPAESPTLGPVGMERRYEIFRPSPINERTGFL